MSEALLVSIATALFIGILSSALKSWRDIAVLKRDVDALAEILGTERSKARKESADEKSNKKGGSKK